MAYWRYPRYVPVGEKKAKAEKKLKALKKKNPNIKPVVIDGNAIAKTWWGKSWNTNLERYADYSNRIGRGRSYVRHGAVLDLEIRPGEINSLVMGSNSSPYSITIKIEKISSSIQKHIRKECKGRLDSMQELLMGKFPKDLSEILTAKDKGLFPTPKEINFSCSCPDGASMCKHVAATLYGVGARLDQDPSLFFKLRQIEISDLISQAVEDKTQELLDKAEKKSKRTIEINEISDLFGIDMEDDPDIKPKRKNKLSNKKSSSKPAKPAKPVRKAKKEKQSNITIKTVPSAKQIIKRNIKKVITPSGSATETIEKIIKRSRKGVNVAAIKKKTGFDETKIRNIVFRLKKQGKIKNISRGVYV